MPLPPFGVAIVVYLACGGVLWLTVHLLAPIGYHVSLWRAVGAAILMSLANLFLPPVLFPQIHDWYLLVILLAHILIVKSVLWLPFWRSLLTVLIYWIAMFAAVWMLFKSPMSKPPHASRNGTSLCPDGIPL